MVNRTRLQRKLIVMLGVVVLVVFSCARSGGLTLQASDDGGEVELRQGETLTVSLEGNPTTGYTWEAVEVDEQILRPLGEPAFTPESEAVGAGGTQVLRFRAAGAGRTTLRLVYHRPWEEAEPERTFSVEVIVR